MNTNRKYYEEVQHESVKQTTFEVIKGKKKINKLNVAIYSVSSTMLFLTCILFLNTCAEMVLKQNEIRKLTMDIREVKSSASGLQSIMSNDLYLEEIKTKAQEKLGMVEPLEHQIVYIELPQEPTIEYYN